MRIFTHGYSLAKSVTVSTTEAEEIRIGFEGDVGVHMSREEAADLCEKLEHEQHGMTAYDRGYRSAMMALMEWHRDWTMVLMARSDDTLDPMVEPGMRERIETMMNNGETFADWIDRELFFFWDGERTEGRGGPFDEGSTDVSG